MTAARPRLVVSADGPPAWDSWRASFERVAPDLDVFSWYDPARAVEEAQYALVWEPEPGEMARMGGMRAILSAAAGVNHLVGRPDFPHGVMLVRMGGSGTVRLMADYVLWAAIGLLRGARGWQIRQQQRIWQRDLRFRTVEGAHIGVLGLGHIGVGVARCLARAGAVVSGWSRTPRVEDGMAMFAGPEGLPGFLASLDIVVNLLPGTLATRGLIDAAFLARLPPSAGLINVGRGEHVIERDLLDALDAGRLAGAVLDVATVEPLPADSPLWSHPLVTVTPHIASEASRDEQADVVARAIRQIESGERPALLYEPSRGY